jgi:hemerythrin-like metal-binding protein
MSANWDDSMETGDPHMDRQHREIIELVDRLDAIGVDDESWLRHAHDILDQVMDLTVTHFTTEELLMVRVGYPADAQRRMLEQHRDFKSYARIRVLEFRTGDRSGLALLPGFLRMWLVEHEFGLDRELVGWMRSHSEDEVAVRV